MRSTVKRNSARKRRALRARDKIMGTPERPRLSVYRSNKTIWGQLIDDLSGRTLAAAQVSYQLAPNGLVGTIDGQPRAFRGAHDLVPSTKGPPLACAIPLHCCLLYTSPSPRDGLL